MTMNDALRKAVKRLLPAPFFHRVRDLTYTVQDLVGPPPPDPRVPPLRHQYDGPRGYEIFAQNGQEALRFYQDVVAIQSDSTMLDIGSGIGRKTLPLLDVLGSRALYVGIDIDQRGVRWCSRNITPRHPRFVFFHFDIYNKFYNPGGRVRPSQVVLPFPGGFDLVALWSVFTHMYPADIAHYLAEIARVLKPGGLVVASYYVMSERAKQQINSGATRERITHRVGEHAWTYNPNIPEELIAVEEPWLRGAYQDAGLSIERAMFGGWSNNPVPAGFAGLNWQDIVVATKT